MPWRPTLKFQKTFATALVFCGCLIGVDAAAEAWRVHGKLQGKNGEKAENVSGIACATTEGFPRTCLVVDDNLQAAQFVTVTDGKIVAGEMVSLIDNTFEGKRLELDGEGVAYADGFFYGDRLAWLSPRQRPLTRPE